MRLSAPVYRLRRAARALSRAQSVPLHQALDHIARVEGFRSWSHLQARWASLTGPAERVLSEVADGEMLLLAARPGHGKTLLALDLAVKATGARRPAYVFTLEDSDATMAGRLSDLGVRDRPSGLVVDTSDEIDAFYIGARLAKDAPRRAVVVVDYLQLLDQRRSAPPVDQQVAHLSKIARETGAVVIALSQVDRRFEASGKSLPDLHDVRLPNPVDLSRFDLGCFLHDGEVALARLP